MKQLLFLLLFPCLCVAQYTGNGNQKITLGEQTTADGLVWRGRLADTANLLTNKLDTSVYIVLDTGTRAMWYYRASTTPKWTRLVDSLNNLQGTLSVANGGTGASIRTFVDTINTQTVNGAKTFTSAATFNSSVTTGGIIQSGAGAAGGFKIGSQFVMFNNNGVNRYYTGTTSAIFNTYDGGADLITILPTGATTFNSSVTTGGIIQSGAGAAGGFKIGSQFVMFNNNGVNYYYSGTNSSVFTNSNGTADLITILPTGATTFNSSVTATTGIFTNYAGGGTGGASIDNTGQIVRTSSIELKKDITNIKYGLNEILQINPINFNWIDENKFGNENENGFIAEDVMSIIPNVVGSDANGLFMDYTKIIPILTKAIQEQNVLIKALEQRILILENK